MDKLRPPDGDSDESDPGDKNDRDPAQNYCQELLE